MTASMPWSRWWWKDWLGDSGLRACSLSARGLWMEMLCVASDGTPYGHVTINGAPVTARQLATLAGATERQVTRLLLELEKAGVFSRTEGGVIYSRRMVRDAQLVLDARVAGKLGGNPALKRTLEGGVNPPLIPLDAKKLRSLERKNPHHAPPRLTAADAPPSQASPARNVTKLGQRLPDDWKPDLDDKAFAQSLGLDADLMAEEFRDYWRSVPGSKGRKLDWSATWRNRCRERAARGGTTAPTNGRRETPSEERRRKLGLSPAPAPLDKFR